MRIRSTVTLGVIALALVASACTIHAGPAPRLPRRPGHRPDSTLPPTDEPVAASWPRTSCPAVVNVTTDVFSAPTVGGTRSQGVGTGFIVRSDGFIVTNCHVVEGASKITVFTSDEEPDRYDARVVGGDCQHDLAVLKIDATDLPTLPLGDPRDLALGQDVVAIGLRAGAGGRPERHLRDRLLAGPRLQVQDPYCDACRPDCARTYST